MSSDPVAVLANAAYVDEDFEAALQHYTDVSGGPGSELDHIDNDKMNALLPTPDLIAKSLWSQKAPITSKSFADLVRS
jgi:hypothetical protein